MALHFDFSNVENYEEVTTNPANPDEWHPVADALVWLSIICGYPSITEKNLDTVTQRIMSYQRVTGGFLSFQHQPVFIMPADIKRFVGLKTNASTLTDAQWVRKIGRLALEQVRYFVPRLEREGHTSALEKVNELQQPQQPTQGA